MATVHLYYALQAIYIITTNCQNARRLRSIAAPRQSAPAARQNRHDNPSRRHNQFRVKGAGQNVRFLTKSDRSKELSYPWLALEEIHIGTRQALSNSFEKGASAV
jgi:hypothetical protein